MSDGSTPVHSAVYVGEGRLLVTTRWGFHLYCPAGEMSIVPQLVHRGVFEPELATYLMNNISSGDVVIDVGANIGIFTTMMGHLVGEAGQVFSFEPVQANFEFLRDNVESNWLGRRVSLHRFALAETSGSAQIKTHARWGGLSSMNTVGMREMTMGVSDSGSGVEDIRTIALDDVLEGEGDGALVKIDVEGAELGVFRGMSQLLASGRIRAVVFECIAERMGGHWGAFVGLLREYEGHGWSFGALGADGRSLPVSVDDISAHGYLYHVVMSRSADPALPVQREALVVAGIYEDGVR